MSSRLFALSVIAALLAARSVSGVCAGSIKFETVPFACCALEGDGVYHVIVSSNIAPASVQYVVGPSHDFDHPDTNMYTPISGTLSFATGETTKTIDVPLLNDDDWARRRSRRNSRRHRSRSHSPTIRYTTVIERTRCIFRERTAASSPAITRRCKRRSRFSKTIRRRYCRSTTSP